MPEGSDARNRFDGRATVPYSLEPTDKTKGAVLAEVVRVAGRGPVTGKGGKGSVFSAGRDNLPGVSRGKAARCADGARAWPSRGWEENAFPGER